jgi:3-hydroxyacyl-CoA dehydrogenase
MKILVLGSGLIGPASAYNALVDPEVTQVTLCDIDPQQLDAAQAKLSGLEDGQRLSTVQLDVRDQAATIRAHTTPSRTGSPIFSDKRLSRPDIPAQPRTMTSTMSTSSAN